MKAGLNTVGISIEKTHEDEVSYKSLSLAIDPLYQPTQHVRTYGVVTSPPMRLQRPYVAGEGFLQEGDKVYFKYTSLEVYEAYEKGHVMIPYNFMYARVRDGVITPVPGITLCKPYYGEDAEYDKDLNTYVRRSSQGLIIDPDVKPDERIAIVEYIGEPLDDQTLLDVSVGDRVFREAHTNLAYDIEGELMYVVENELIIGKYLTPA